MTENRKNLFLPGEIIIVQQEIIVQDKLYNLPEKNKNFHIEDVVKFEKKEYFLIEYVGSGLGGAVWKAIDQESGQEVAIKIYNPPGTSGVIKKILVNAFHLIFFQSKFPYKHIRQSLFANMVISSILADILSEKLGYPALARTKAIFFSSAYNSWAEVLDWVEGKSYQRPQRNNFLGALKQFNKIANELGFGEHSYQVEYRLGAPAHTVKNILEGSDGNFYWVDKMPAVPVCLFIYPYHFRAIINNIRRKNFYPCFDKVDVDKLGIYIENNFDSKEKENKLILLEVYKKIYKYYLESRIDILGRIKFPNLKWRVKEKTINHWYNCRQISKKSARLLDKYKLLFLLFFILDFIPILGRLIRKIIFKPALFRKIYKLIVPLRQNNYRQNKWNDFKYKYRKKISMWAYNDLLKLKEKGLITKEQLNKFEAETRTTEWRKYLKILFLYTLGKIPGDLIAVALGGYALFDIFQLIQENNFYLSTPIILGVLGIFIPGIYRVIITLIIKKCNSNLIFRWYWVLFALIPSFGYLAVILQVLSKTFSVSACRYLLKYKIVSAVKTILDIIPGYREFDFYILDHLRK